jgi:type III secretory pathway component EscV
MKKKEMIKKLEVALLYKDMQIAIQDEMLDEYEKEIEWKDIQFSEMLEKMENDIKEKIAEKDEEINEMAYELECQDNIITELNAELENYHQIIDEADEQEKAYNELSIDEKREIEFQKLEQTYRRLVNENIIWQPHYWWLTKPLSDISAYYEKNNLNK